MKKPQFEYESWYAKHGISPNATKKEKDIWWGKELEYWREGRFGLTGAHYFALTQGFVKDARGYKKRPVWRDVDNLIYEAYEEARRTNNDLFVTKRREVGLSLIFGGIIPVWISLTNPGSTSLITSADKQRLEELYKSKTRVVFDSLEEYIRPGVVSNRQAGYLHMGRREQSTGTIHGLDSQIVTKETVDTPSAFEAYRAMHVFIDEAMLHPKADQVYKSAQASVKSGFVKIAPIVIGGSAGESTSVGQKLAMNLWNSSESLNLLTVFLPGDMGIMEAPELDDSGKSTGKIINFCPNGHSDRDGAREWILKTREKLDKIDDKSFLNSFIKQYPLDIQEVFSFSAQGNLPKHIIDKLNTQERIILSEKPQIETSRLYRDTSGVIQIKPDGTSNMRFLHRPLPNHTYIAGIDPIPFVSKSMGDGSKQAIVIKDIDTNEYVAFYAERDSDPDQIIDNMVILQEYYNNAIAMLEINRGGVVLEKYKQLSKLRLLAKKPINLGKGFHKKEDMFGYYKSDHTSERGNKYLVDYLNHYTDHIWFSEIIEEAKNYLVENTDIVDAMVACEILHQNIIERHKQNEQANKPIKKSIPVLEFRNGRYVKVWKEVRVN